MLGYCTALVLFFSVVWLCLAETRATTTTIKPLSAERSNFMISGHHRHQLKNHENNLQRFKSNSTTKSLKLTLVNSYPMNNGDFHGGNTFNTNHNRWNANENVQNKFLVETNWKEEVTVAAPTSPTTITPRDYHLHHHPRTYTKQHHVGRNICTNNKPAPTLRTRTFYLSLDGTKNNEQSKTLNEVVSTQCCPGWGQVTKHSHGCTKPLCKYPCKNGGKCVKPDQCSCPAGFTGNYCEKDINECKENKPCDHICYNTHGSYYCSCRDGFSLQSDKESCKKHTRSLHGDQAFEARDMENDIDYEDLSSKINHIEQLIGSEKEFNNEIKNKLQSTSVGMNNLKTRIENLENRQQNFNYINEKLNAQAVQTQKLEYIVNLLYKCRMKNSIFCSLL